MVRRFLNILLYFLLTFAPSVVHHGYGHATRDYSQCSEDIKRAYFLNGTLPEKAEADCYADRKPYAKDGDSLLEAQWAESFRGGRKW